MITNKKGTIFIQVLLLSMLMIFIAVGVANMLLQDVHMIKRLKRSTQAQFLAEAGINRALATIANMGGMSTLAQGNFLNGNLGTGDYVVTVDETGGRWMLISVGTSEGVEKTVGMEIEDITPTALDYIMTAQNDLKIRAGFISFIDINGPIHGNNSVRLSTGLLLGFMDISDTATYTQDNAYVDVYWWGQIVVGSDTFSSNTHITRPGWQQPLVTFPTFDYQYYKDLAMGADLADDPADDYYAGDTTFGAWDSTTSLNPVNSVIYVDGTATFEGTCHLYGGVVADNIVIPVQQGGYPRKQARLYQHDSGDNRNFIISKNNIELYGRLYVTDSDNPLGALVYAENDFRSRRAGSRIDINGCIIARHDINLRDYIAYIVYDYVSVSPDMGTEAGSLPFRVVSWNR